MSKSDKAKKREKARWEKLKKLKGSDGKVLWDSSKRGTYRKKEHGELPCAS